MSKCAVCLDGVVVNIIIADASDPCPLENGVLIAIDDVACDIGWTRTDTGFVNPNPPEWSDL